MPLLTSGQVAKILNVSHSTINRLADRNALKVSQLVARGNRLFYSNDVEEYMKSPGYKVLKENAAIFTNALARKEAERKACREEMEMEEVKNVQR